MLGPSQTLIRGECWLDSLCTRTTPSATLLGRYHVAAKYELTRYRIAWRCLNTPPTCLVQGGCRKKKKARWVWYCEKTIRRCSRHRRLYRLAVFAPASRRSPDLICFSNCAIMRWWCANVVHFAECLDAARKFIWCVSLFFQPLKKVKVVEKGMIDYNTHISTKVKFNWSSHTPIKGCRPATMTLLPTFLLKTSV